MSTGAGRRSYVGLACSFHDSALAIVDDSGELVFAEGTERSLQTKRAINAPADELLRVPSLLLEHCGPDADLVIGKSWSQRGHFGDIGFFLRRYSNHGGAGRFAMLAQLAATALAGNNVRLYAGNPDLHAGAPRSVKVRSFNHHLTHAVTSCYTSPFDEALVAIIDGIGQGTSTSYFHFRDGGVTPLSGGRSINSLGVFYAYLTSWCGFSSFRAEEWKVMGLAAYGSVDPALRQCMRSLIGVEGLRLIYPTDRKRYYAALRAMEETADKCGPDPLERADIAATGQAVFAEAATELLSNLYDRGLSENLVVGGGCFLNSLYNGSIAQETPFAGVHVPCAPADDGNAIGAALLAYLGDEPGRRLQSNLCSPFLGSSVPSASLERLVRFGGHRGLRREPCWTAADVAALLADGRIVGVMRGRAEMGPRALGNRSILADPRSQTIKDLINDRVKFREQFRPLAPVVLPEHGSRLFENFQASPYMDRALVATDELRRIAPGAVHVDGTARLQTVDRAWSPFLTEVLQQFYEITGVPVLINTSLNIMGKPIVHSVEDALGVFFMSGLDALVLEDYLIEKGCVP